MMLIFGHVGLASWGLSDSWGKVREAKDQRVAVQRLVSQSGTTVEYDVERSRGVERHVCKN